MARFSSPERPPLAPFLEVFEFHSVAAAGILIQQPRVENCFEEATGRRYRADAATGTMRCSYGVPGHMTNGCPGLVGSRGYPWSIPRVFKIISAGPVWTPGVPSTGAA